MDNKTLLRKNKISLIAGLSVLLFLAIASSYAYFSVTQTNNATTSSITEKTETIGNVTLTTNVSKLNLNLNTLSMSPENVGKKYYANSNTSGTPLENGTFGNGIYTLATALVASGDADYDCTYSFNVSATVSKTISDG